jgi:hypothetical protein
LHLEIIVSRLKREFSVEVSVGTPQVAYTVDSSKMAFRIAGTMAFQDAAKKARPVLLEPVMRVEVEVPAEHLGDVRAACRADAAGFSRRRIAAPRTSFRRGSPVGDARLRHRPPIADAGPRDTDDAVRTLRTAQPRRWGGVRITSRNTSTTEAAAQEPDGRPAGSGLRR